MNNNQDICNAFDASEKVYAEGKIHPIKVGMRKVSLTDTIIEGKAIKNGDEKKFKELMPNGTDKMFDEYKEQLDKVIKENNKYMSLVDYIKESLEVI